MVKKSDNRHPRDGGCRKKPKSLKALNHKGTKEAFFVCSRSSGKPKKTLCLRAFVVQRFFAFPDYLLLHEGSGI